MDFWDLTKLMVRRWYVAVPLLLLTALGAVGLAATVKPDYIADSYLTLVNPHIVPGTSATATTRNPWLDMGATALGSAAIYSVQDASVLEPMVRQGYSDNFTIAFDGNTPIIKIEVTADTKAQATGTAQELAQLIGQFVQSLQIDKGATQDQLITVQRLDKGDNVKSSTTKLKRAIIAVVGAGLLLTIALTATLDAILQRRSRRKALQAGGLAAPPREKGKRGHTNGTTPEVAGDVVQLVPAKDQQSLSGTGGHKRSSTGEYRALQREREQVVDQTAIISAVQDDSTTMPMPSDATMILPAPDKDPWAVRDGGSNRGGSGRR